MRRAVKCSPFWGGIRPIGFRSVESWSCVSGSCLPCNDLSLFSLSRLSLSWCLTLLAIAKITLVERFSWSGFPLKYCSQTPKLVCYLWSFAVCFFSSPRAIVIVEVPTIAPGLSCRRYRARDFSCLFSPLSFSSFWNINMPFPLIRCTLRFKLNCSVSLFSHNSQEMLILRR